MIKTTRAFSPARESGHRGSVMLRSVMSAQPLPRAHSDEASHASARGYCFALPLASAAAAATFSALKNFSGDCRIVPIATNGLA